MDTASRLSATRALENLKKEAKRWLKALRADERGSSRVVLSAPSPGPCRTRLARRATRARTGTRLRGLVGAQKTNSNRSPSDDNRREELVNLFLENACADPILANGPAAHASRARAALRILTRYPAIARDSIHTAVVCGDLEYVERILKDRPAAATEPGGPLRRRWTARTRETLDAAFAPLLRAASDGRSRRQRCRHRPPVAGPWR